MAASLADSPFARKPYAEGYDRARRRIFTMHIHARQYRRPSLLAIATSRTGRDMAELRRLYAERQKVKLDIVATASLADAGLPALACTDFVSSSIAYRRRLLPAPRGTAAIAISPGRRHGRGAARMGAGRCCFDRVISRYFMMKAPASQ